MLAFACKRAGKTRDEGRAYYSMGVLYDNIGKYEKAIEFYGQFLNVCKSIGDVHGEALAYNCIGVDYQLLAE
jgi:tetratricopeptide (TPR) repeat protein